MLFWRNNAGGIMNKCWDSVNKKTILSCLIHPCCLPHLPGVISADGRECCTQAERLVVCDIFIMFFQFSFDPNNFENLDSLGLLASN
jgi:hypothetical protein